LTGNKVTQPMLSAGLRTDDLGTLIGGLFNTLSLDQLQPERQPRRRDRDRKPLRLHRGRDHPDRSGAGAPDGRTGRTGAHDGAGRG